VSILGLLSRLRALGAYLWVEEGRLRLSAPSGALTPDLRQEIAGHRDEILAFLARSGDMTAAAPPLLPVPRSGELPLSFAQQSIWFNDQLRPGDPLFNEPIGMRCTGTLSVEALAASLSEMVRRHEALRGTFHHRAGRPFLTISPPSPTALPLVDLTGLPDSERRRELARLALAEARRPFDLSRGPLLRLTLLRLTGQEWLLLFVIHHIVHDGWSGHLIQREVATLYEAFVFGRPSPLREPALQYVDFACWQRHWLRGEVLEGQLHGWSKRLAGAPTALRLATDRPYPAEPTFRGRRRPVALPAALGQELRKLAQGEGATLFMALLAAFGVLLHLYTGQEDLLVATPVANRHRVEVEEMIGLFANLLVLRLDLSGDPELVELVGRVREVVLSAQEHQDLPFETLVERLQPGREPGRHPLVQVHFSLESEPLSRFVAGGVEMVPMPIDHRVTQYELDLNLVEAGGGLAGDLIYAGDLFEEVTAGRLLTHLESVLQTLVERPGTRLREVAVTFVAAEKRMRTEVARSLGQSSRGKLSKAARRPTVMVDMGES
jgi:hypothetical protein